MYAIMNITSKCRLNKSLKLSKDRIESDASDKVKKGKLERFSDAPQIKAINNAVADLRNEIRQKYSITPTAKRKDKNGQWSPGAIPTPPSMAWLLKEGQICILAEYAEEACTLCEEMKNKIFPMLRSDVRKWYEPPEYAEGEERLRYILGREEQLLNGDYRRSDYPGKEEVESYFSFEWGILALEIPKGLPEGLEQSASTRLEQSKQEAQEWIEGSFCFVLEGLIGHLIDSLNPGEGKRKRKFTETTLTSAQEFLKTFDLRAQDWPKLIEQKQKLKEIIGDVDADDIRKDREGYGRRLMEKLKPIQADVTKLSIEKKNRRLILDD